MKSERGNSRLSVNPTHDLGLLHEPGSRFAMMEPAETVKLEKGHCPHCDHRGFVIGPAAYTQTMVQLNIECGNVECRSRFNVSFYSGRILMAHHLFDGRCGPPWPSEPEARQ